MSQFIVFERSIEAGEAGERLAELTAYRQQQTGEPFSTAFAEVQTENPGLVELYIKDLHRGSLTRI